MVENNQSLLSVLNSREDFSTRHIGPDADETGTLLSSLGFASLNELADRALPKAIRMRKGLELPKPLGEHEAMNELRGIAAQNEVYRSYIGLGYAAAVVPPAIQRNILENPGWYTQYTPYQAEISQGRLEALLNFQTMVADLTGLEIANASLLDEGTAASEAMTLSYSSRSSEDAKVFFVSEKCLPQTIAVLQSRAEPLGIEIVVGDHRTLKIDGGLFGILLQYPAVDGVVFDYTATIAAAKKHGVMVTLAADILSLCLLRSPGELGADIAVGNTQRFGIPVGFGGPHAAYFATRDEHKRKIPGRIVGVSKDRHGRNAIRLALQTREQHIRREKATSNICTAQVLLAVMTSMYAVYHGPKGLRRIAQRVHGNTVLLAQGLRKLGCQIDTDKFFDTLTIRPQMRTSEEIVRSAALKRINFRKIDAKTIALTLDETVTRKDLEEILAVFAGRDEVGFTLEDLAREAKSPLAGEDFRKSAWLNHPVFNSYHSESELMRYIKRLEAKDLSLTTAMIPLGSCTMKLNAAAELMPVSWAQFGSIHPFAPSEQARGYARMFRDLETWLSEITGFAAVSLQPNSGSQGEYAGLLVIRKYLRSSGQSHRDVCLIPQSAHGTNPASAVMAGMRVVVVACDKNGNVDVDDLSRKAAEHSRDLAALMVTYPSTHGVFEERIMEICEIVHKHGGQVYMDGANMNAQVGLCRPGDFGPDVCHLNLHKTFCIPHGGGGPGMGPIGVRAHLAPYLPGHPLVKTGGKEGIGPVSAAPWGSASILPISWMYIRMMGPDGLTRATQTAILNANYIARRLDAHFPILYRGNDGLVAHECIVDIRDIKVRTGVDVEDIAKRLMDYGFHAPTISFPVAGTMMIEPTESESKAELDRFCDAMISIRNEIRDIESGKSDARDNPLKNAPHTVELLAGETWERPYSREQAVFPSPWTKTHKYWPPVARVDNALGDRNLICSCPPMDEYQR